MVLKTIYVEVHASNAPFLFAWYIFACFFSMCVLQQTPCPWGKPFRGHTSGQAANEAQHGDEAVAKQMTKEEKADSKRKDQRDKFTKLLICCIYTPEV